MQIARNVWWYFEKILISKGSTLLDQSHNVGLVCFREAWSGDESKSLHPGAGEGDVTTKTPGRERAARWTKREGKSLWRMFLEVYGHIGSYWYPKISLIMS